MDDSKTVSVFLDFPRTVEGGKIQGILPNRRFAPVMREVQEARTAGFLFASLCTMACVIEAMVCYAAECKGWEKPTLKKRQTRRSEFGSAFRYCKSREGEGVLQPLLKELEKFSKKRNHIIHESLRLDSVPDEDRELLDSFIELMDKLESCLFLVSTTNNPGVVNPDHPEFFR